MAGYPTGRINRVNQPGKQYNSYTGYRQAPINRRKVTPYTLNSYACNEIKDRFGPHPFAYDLALGYLGNMDRGYAQAYDRYAKSARNCEKASMAITLIQWRQSLDMVTLRAKQIATAVWQLRRGNFSGTFKALGLTRPSRKGIQRMKRLSAKSPARGWLELQFGWMPLYGDIHTAINALQADIPVERARGSGSYSDSIDEVLANWPSYRWSRDGLVTSGHKLAGDVAAINSNRFLASSLGLTNPAHVAWDAVPFSFVVDWFLPVGQFLQSFDAFTGIVMTNEIHSHKVTAMSGEHFVVHNEPWETRHRYGTSTCMSRSSGVPLPSFGSRVQPLSGSLWRAITGVALAVSQLKKVPHGSSQALN